jgi:hypothetical protein
MNARHECAATSNFFWRQWALASNIGLSSSHAGVLRSAAIVVEKNKMQEKEEQISVELREFIDRAIVPILVQEYLKELRQQAVVASPNEGSDAKPNARNR